MAGGTYITRIARHLGVFDDPTVEPSLTLVPSAARVPLSLETMFTMGMLTADRRRLRGWVDPDAEAEELFEGDAEIGADAHQDDPPPPPPPPPPSTQLPAAHTDPTPSTTPSSSSYIPPTFPLLIDDFTSITQPGVLHGLVADIASLHRMMSHIIQPQTPDFSIPSLRLIPTPFPTSPTIPTSIPTPTSPITSPTTTHTSTIPTSIAPTTIATASSLIPDTPISTISTVTIPTPLPNHIPPPTFDPNALIRSPSPPADITTLEVVQSLVRTRPTSPPSRKVKLKFKKKTDPPPPPPPTA